MYLIMFFRRRHLDLYCILGPYFSIQSYQQNKILFSPPNSIKPGLVWGGNKSIAERAITSGRCSCTCVFIAFIIHWSYGLTHLKDHLLQGLFRWIYKQRPLFFILVFVWFLVLSSAKYHILKSNSMGFQPACISGPRFNIYKISGPLSAHISVSSPRITPLCYLVYTDRWISQEEWSR